MTIDAKTGHDFHDETDHGDDREAIQTCSCCNAGLDYCKTCHGAEGSLPTDCPGRAMNAFEEAIVFAGIVDFAEDVWKIGSIPDPAARLIALVDAKTAEFFGLPKILKDAALAAIKRGD